MKAIKFWSFLCFLCVGIAFSSCDNDGEDVDSGDSPVEEYVNSEGVQTGKSLYEVCSNIEGSGTSELMEKVATLGSIYEDYKENKDEEGWKAQFITGIAMAKFGLEDEAAVTSEMRDEVSGIVSMLNDGINVDDVNDTIATLYSIEKLLKQ